MWTPATDFQENSKYLIYGKKYAIFNDAEF